MENGKTQNGLNKRLWRVMESNSKDVSEIPTLDTMGVDNKRARLRVDCSSFKKVEAMM